MNRKNRNPGLDALYARLDEIQMNAADRLAARHALAQADELVDLMLGIADLFKRAFGAAPLSPTSAHG